MKLIVDAGSTKTHWSLLTGESGEIIRIKTEGINPVIQSKSQIGNIIREASERLQTPNIVQIHFFGAGCVSESVIGELREIITSYWPDARTNIDSDMVGACKALFGDGSGLACILGTGSNSCYFSRGEILDKIPSLGYILGDEGSGAALGKRLLNAIYKKQLSPEITEKFKETYKSSLEDVIVNVYRKPNPSKFLASFSPFISENRAFPEIEKLIYEELENFIIKNILPYKLKPVTKIGFVGSIAKIYKDILVSLLKKYQFENLVILEVPMPALEVYFMNN